MNIKHDYSYLEMGNRDLLIEKGYADLDINSLNFDRFYTEEQREENCKISHTMTTEQWSKYCDEISKEIYTKLLPIAELINSKFKLYQYNENVLYKGDWDLFFYSNQGWNNKDYFEHMQLSFNDKRTVEENKKLLDELLEIFNNLDVKGVQCRIQYEAREHKEDIKKIANNICKRLLNTFINYQGNTGKIKVVDQYENEMVYGFFKKRSKSKYYKVSDEYLVLNY